MKFMSKMWIHKDCKDRMEQELTCTECGKLEADLGRIRQCVLCGDAYCKKHKKKINGVESMVKVGKKLYGANAWIHSKKTKKQCILIRDAIRKSVEPITDDRCPECNEKFDKSGWCAVCELPLCSKCPEKNWLKVGSGMLPRFMHKTCMKKYELQLNIHKRRATLPKTFSYIKSVRSLRGMMEDEEGVEEENGKTVDEKIDDIFGEEEDMEDAPPLESHQEPHDHDERPEPSNQVHEAAPKSLVDDTHSSPHSHDHSHVQNTTEEHEKIKRKSRLNRRMSKQGRDLVRDHKDEDKKAKEKRFERLKKKYEEIGSMLKSKSIRGDEMKKKYIFQVESCIAALKGDKRNELHQHFERLLGVLKELDLPDSIRPTCEPARDSDMMIVRSRAQEDHVEEAKGDRGIPKPKSSKPKSVKGESMFGLCCTRHVHTEVE